jgi:hypothetical protein
MPSRQGIARLDTVATEIPDASASFAEAAVQAIRTALEKDGVEFTNGDEPGVKLRKAK